MPRIRLNKEVADIKDDGEPPARGLRFGYGSILGKVTLFIVIGIVFSYAIGAAAGWMIVDRSSQEQWHRQAKMNAHITSYIIRSIYTSIAVDMNEMGQITGIVTDRFPGDDEYILETGFSPADVLALAATQTRNDVWLFRYAEDTGFISIANADGVAGGIMLESEYGKAITPQALQNVFSGFIRLERQVYFASILPVVTPSGTMLGAIVSSIGGKSDLYKTHNTLLRNSLLALFAILIATSLIVIFPVRQFFYSVPVLIQALARIAQDNTGNVTPFLDRSDEIGRLAAAIEKLRQAVVEREYLQQVKETAQRMEYMAHHDSLTGLPNRTFFSLALDTAIAKLMSKGVHFNLMLLDLDRFKAVNDTFGHAAGDELLSTVSSRITVLLGSDDIIARLGGDEFAVIQSVRRNQVLEARQLAEQIIKEISLPFYYAGNELRVGISIGIACAPLYGDTAHVLMENADLALYTSKNNGRGNYHFFECGMTMPHLRSHLYEWDIEGGIERDEFELYYQPQCLADRTIVGYEALVRWRHPEHGLLKPDAFITLAEKSGLIVMLGEWIIRRACVDAALYMDDQFVSVNVSMVQLNRAGLTAIIEHALAESGLPPSRLEIEVTESVMLDRQIALPVLQAIRELGIGVALDDLGTGYASLNCLTDFPFTRVKLDQELIAGLTERDANRIIVSTIIGLVQRLGMEAAAEGVKTEQQQQWLINAGCQYMQGELFGDAQPITRIATPRDVRAIQS
ncbi:EAL domain-containing protein [Brenneria izbisi]|uniref:diguanylate cyclase n=1 Tax=Brenneria izbisi TaxID=2939450 RepID=A0AA41XYX8_9GAMM|nr:EAL domain-containing protein [Brenneria izbisi]MCV9879386.1 EAL domain-containing protein [Brenneria izbisi]MCV9882586.1 EAL domain-containing protein [Brenneria izbisi]